MAKDSEITRAEVYLSHLLRWGVLLCAAVILTGWLSGNAAITNKGLLLLIFLPIARVFAAALIFLKNRDYIFVFLSLFVLAILIGSLVLGKNI
jgi:uncharacterized membrane protein